VYNLLDFLLIKKKKKNLLDFFGGLVLLFSTRDKYKCFATSVLVIFMIVELYATFFFGG
jgi:hypothetical protein